MSQVNISFQWSAKKFKIMFVVLLPSTGNDETVFMRQIRKNKWKEKSFSMNDTKLHTRSSHSSRYKS